MTTPTERDALGADTYLEKFPRAHRASADRAYQDGFADGADSVRGDADDFAACALELIRGDGTADSLQRCIDLARRGLGLSHDPIKPATTPEAGTGPQALPCEREKAEAAGYIVVRTNPDRWAWELRIRSITSVGWHTESAAWAGACQHFATAEARASAKAAGYTVARSGAGWSVSRPDGQGIGGPDTEAEAWDIATTHHAKNKEPEQC